MLVLILILIASIFYLLYLRTTNKEYRRKLSKIVSEPALPILGHALSIGRKKEDILPALEKMWRKFNCDKFILKLGPLHQVVLTKPSDIEVILSSNEHVNKNVFYKVLKGTVGDSLVVTDEHRWRPLRKIWNSAFNYKCLEAYVNILTEEVSDLLSNLNDHSNKEVNIFPLYNKNTLTVTCRISLGFDATSSKGLGNYIHNIQKLLDITGTKIFSVWKSINFLFNLTEEGKMFNESLKVLEDYIETSINTRREELKSILEEVKSGRTNIESVTKSEKFYNKHFNFLSHLLLTNAEKEFLNNEDIKSELITFTLGGFETTSNVTSFAAYSLALNPEIQEIAYQEQLSISCGNINKPITFQDLNNMPYLEVVIKETLRLYPPGTFFGRRLTKDVTLPDGVELPAGCNVLFIPFLTHRMPDLFPEPESFNPDRFLVDHPSQYAFFPFSAGPRNCVGYKLGLMEAKFYLASTIRSFELLPPLGERPKLVVDFSLASSTGVNVRLRKRNCNLM